MVVRFVVVVVVVVVVPSLEADEEGLEERELNPGGTKDPGLNGPGPVGMPVPPDPGLNGPDPGVVGPVGKRGIPPDPGLNGPDPGEVQGPGVPPDPGLKGPDPGVLDPVGKLGPKGVLPPGDDLTGTESKAIVVHYSMEIRYYIILLKLATGCCW